MATAAVPPPNAAPEPPADGDSLYEVVDGQVMEKRPMGVYEGVLASLLVEYLGSFARAHRLGKVVGEVLFLINASTNLQRRPDVAFVSSARWSRDRGIPKSAAWDVIPDLAIEVVSPTSTAGEVMGKVEEYFQAGVQRVWVVYPESSSVYVHESRDLIRVLRLGDDLDGAPLLPGFRLPLATLFEDETTPSA